MADLLDLIRPTPASIQQMIMQQQMAKQQTAPVSLSQNGAANPDYQMQAAPMPMQMASAAPAAAYEPTSGSKMEADSRTSTDDLMAQLAAQRNQYRQQDQNQQWMSFFSKLASSKNPRLLGALGEGADALTETRGKQNANNQLLDQAALQDQIKYREWQQDQQRQQQLADQTGEYQKGELGLKRQELANGKYVPVKDAFGNVSAIFDSRTGKIVSNAQPGTNSSADIPTDPSADPQVAAQQILDEVGTPLTPIASRQDITGRNAQIKAYRDSANGAKAAIQQLDQLDAQTGKYTPGKASNLMYGAESSMGMGGKEATARTEADKASKNLANAFMSQNVGAKGAGIRMVEFDAGAVPNADMTDEARTNLIKVNKSIANSQLQRAAISDMYPRLHTSNVNSIMDAYESANPPILPRANNSGDPVPNPKWMPYKDWLKAGRPNTAALALKEQGSKEAPSGEPAKATTAKTIHFNDLPE